MTNEMWIENVRKMAPIVLSLKNEGLKLWWWKWGLKKWLKSLGKKMRGFSSG